MTSDEALAFWLARANYERRPARPGELKLDRMAELADRLGRPHDHLRIVHVAGSKGKGSTAAMFDAVGRAAGLRTGLFTSPHLIDIAERIQVNGVPITRDDLAALLTEVKPAVDAMDAAGEAPSFFEIATALAFLHFHRSSVELAVVEVGLGGRFDSTNICRPILSVITSISYEHTAILGNRLEQIAFEKAGIIKPGVPVVSGVVEPDAATVIRDVAAERGSPLTEIGRDFSFHYQPGQVNLDGTVTPASVRLDSGNEYALGLLGRHQAANASLVAIGFGVMQNDGLRFSESALADGLAHVLWPARMEVFSGPPMIVLDCAHNVASAKALVECLDESFPKCRRGLVFSSSADKDVQGILNVLAGEFDEIVLTKFIENPRALPPETLLAIFHETKSNSRAAMSANPCESLLAAQRLKLPLIVVAGSVFLAGEIRALLDSRRQRAV